MILNRNELLPFTVLGNIWDMLPIELWTDSGAQGIMWCKEGFAVSAVKPFDSYMKAGIRFSWMAQLHEPPLEHAEKAAMQKWKPVTSHVTQKQQFPVVKCMSDWQDLEIIPAPGWGSLCRHWYELSQPFSRTLLLRTGHILGDANCQMLFLSQVFVISCSSTNL